VPAEAFFKDLYTTDRAPDELLIEIEIPKRPGWRVGFGELSRRQGDFAVVGLAAAAETTDGAVRALRLVYFGAESHARLAGHAAAAARGTRLDDAAAEAIVAALDRDLNPMASLQGRPDTKLHLAKVLTRRVLGELRTAA
jgi:carbon-monoxide dehydrogenase medium subunit